MDSNLSRARARERFVDNKLAFDDVIGDPFAWPEPITGQYAKLKARSSVMATKNNFDEVQVRLNPARPNPIDFFCDVEAAIMAALPPEMLQGFVDTYITETTTEAFTPLERSKLEQKVGSLFRKRKLTPVARYFITIRMRKNVSKGQNQSCKTTKSAYSIPAVQVRSWR